MLPDREFLEQGLLIVTGSTLGAERRDRPLAYGLKGRIEERLEGMACRREVVVIGDLWYLNCEPLHQMPMISVGGPAVNAVTGQLFKRVPTALVVDNALLVQMDLTLEDLRVVVWGGNSASTVDAVDIFVNRGYLGRFLEGVLARSL